MSKKNEHNKINIRNILHTLFVVALIVFIVLSVVTQIYLWTHVRGSILMGSRGGYSLFETIYLFKKAPKTMILGYISVFGIFGSGLGILVTK